MKVQLSNLNYLDTCASGAHNCDRLATCENTQTGFKCVCPTGYSGDGTKCEPVGWRSDRWSSCSVTCGDGHMDRRVRCQRGRAYVSDTQCDQTSRPSTRVACQRQACPSMTKWVYTKWSECSKSCGTGRQTRKRHCETQSDQTSDECDQLDTTQLSKLCFRQVCAGWAYRGWSTCSRSCGGGQMTRDVFCQQGSASISDSQCDMASKPRTSVPCQTEACPKPKWVYTSWTECPKSCGTGQQIRDRRCEFESGLASDQCDQRDSTQVTKSCIRQLCPEWTHGDWSPCSRSCGGGKMTRDVYCNNGSKHVADSECDRSSKPSTSLLCNTQACRKPKWVYSEWSRCSKTCGTGQQTRQ